MSDDEETAGGFGEDFEEETEDESEDDTGFGMADEDEDEEDGDGFGVLDEDEGEEEDEEDDNKGGADEASAPPEASKSSVNGAWETFARDNMFEGCSFEYEHPSERVWDKPVSQIPGPLDQVSAPPLYKTLLTFMGDLDKSQDNKESAKAMIDKLCFAGMKSDIMCREMYMQILKQLYHNKSKMSHVRGFLLLNMYLGSFPPPSELINAILEIIELGPQSFHKYSSSRLQATQGKAARKCEPLRAELNAVKTKTLLQLPVSIAGLNEPRHVGVDSLITASKLVTETAEMIGLATSEGWAVRIRSHNAALTSIVDGDQYALDVVVAMEKKFGEGKWRFELFKEGFSPSHPDIHNDSQGLELVTRQISDAINSAKFKLKDSEQAVPLIAKGYYISHGDEVLQGKDLEDYVASVMPKSMVLASSKAENKRASVKKATFAKLPIVWTQIIEKAHAKLPCTRQNTPVDVVQLELIDEVKKVWPHFFATTFDAMHVSGPGFRGMTDVWVSFNEKGIFVGQQGSTAIAKNYPYDEIETITVDKSKFCIKTAIIEGYRSESHLLIFEVVYGDAFCYEKLANRFMQAAKN